MIAVRPVEILADMYVESFGNIEEANMVRFRQKYLIDFFESFWSLKWRFTRWYDLCKKIAEQRFVAPTSKRNKQTNKQTEKSNKEARKQNKQSK